MSDKINFRRIDYLGEVYEITTILYCLFSYQNFDVAVFSIDLGLKKYILCLTYLKMNPYLQKNHFTVFLRTRSLSFTFLKIG